LDIYYILTMVVLAKVNGEVRKIKIRLDWVKDLNEIEQKLEKGGEGKFLVYNFKDGKIELKNKTDEFDIVLATLNLKGNYFSQLKNLREELESILNWYGRYFKEEKYKPFIEWLKYNKPHYYEKIVKYQRLSKAEIDDLIKSLPKDLKDLLLNTEDKKFKEVISDIVKKITILGKEEIIRKILSKVEEIIIRDGTNIIIFRKRDGKWIKIKGKNGKFNKVGEVKEDEILNDLVSLRF
jgi:arsenate reductase-like glutaredoxin family protein